MRIGALGFVSQRNTFAKHGLFNVEAVFDAIVHLHHPWINWLIKFVINTASQYDHIGTTEVVIIDVPLQCHSGAAEDLLQSMQCFVVLCIMIERKKFKITTLFPRLDSAYLRQGARIEVSKLCQGRLIDQHQITVANEANVLQQGPRPQRGFHNLVVN